MCFGVLKEASFLFDVEKRRAFESCVGTYVVGIWEVLGSTV